MSSILEFQASVYDWAERKGWNDPALADPGAPATQLERRLAALALIHLNISEDLERLRKGEAIDPDILAELDGVAADAFGPADEDGNHPPDDGAAYDLNQVKALAKLALVHSEVSEATQCVLEDQSSVTRRGEGGKPEGLRTELADAHIRLFHLEAMISANSEQELEAKMAYNECRPVRHGKLA